MPEKGTTKPLAALDEVHRFPGWKRYLKGLWDTRRDRVDVVVTGSGRLDVYEKGGDSLLGRYHQYRLHPLSVREIVDPGGPPADYEADETLERLIRAAGAPPPPVLDAFVALLRWGGFPRAVRQAGRATAPAVAPRAARPDRARGPPGPVAHPAAVARRGARRAAGAQAGGILSYNALREDLQVALDSVRLWVGYLERLYFVYRVRPYATRLPRALRREPKVYLWDWSEIADPGVRLENMVASHLLKWCHFTQDWGHQPLDLHFVRGQGEARGRLPDRREKKPWLLVEVKLSRTARRGRFTTSPTSWA